MTTKELIDKLKKIDEDSDVFLDGGFALNILEAKSVVYDKERDIVVICVDELKENDLGSEDCELI